jgi:hypothetical protein
MAPVVAALREHAEHAPSALCEAFVAAMREALGPAALESIERVIHALLLDDPREWSHGLLVLINALADAVAARDAPPPPAPTAVASPTPSGVQGAAAALRSMVAQDSAIVATTPSPAAAAAAAPSHDVRLGRSASFVGGSSIVGGALPAAWVARAAQALTPHLFSHDGQVKLSSIETLARMLPRAPVGASKDLFAFTAGPPPHKTTTVAEEAAAKRETYLALGLLLGLVQPPAPMRKSEAPAQEVNEIVRTFNRSYKKGLAMMRAAGMNAQQCAEFLFSTPGFDKVPLGEAIGHKDEFSKEIMAAFAQRMDFSRMELDDALRVFLEPFRLPGEAQIIDRIMEGFAKRYNEGNPGSFQDPDTAYILAFSVIMLNTDAHSPHVRRKMTKADWIHNNRGLDNGKDLPRSLLESIYERITNNEIKLKE